MLAALRTVISSAGPILSIMATSWYGMFWLMPAAVGDEPMPKPISMLPAAMPVLISAPLPASIQLILVPAACSIQPSPLQIMNGLVPKK